MARSAAIDHENFNMFRSLLQRRGCNDRNSRAVHRADGGCSALNCCPGLSCVAVTYDLNLNPLFYGCR